MSLIDIVPDEFKLYDLKKLRKLKLSDRLDIFFTLEYPASTWFYHNVIKIGSEESMDYDTRLRFVKHLCEQDLYYFAKYILKKTKLREVPNREMSEKLMIRKTPGEQERKLICEPRGTYKTTLASHSYPLWRLIKDPEISVQIDSETDKQAKQNYMTVRDELENNFLLKNLWGDYKSVRWNETEIFVSKREKSRRDPSILTIGVETSQNGLHPDICIIDDPCSEINTQTEESMEKVIDHYRLMTPLVDKAGEIIVIMTRWTLNDLAGFIMDNEKDVYSTISIKSCYNPDGSLYAPEILNKKYLENAKKTLGMYRFSANYMNDPKPDTDKSFNRDWLMYYQGYPTRENEETEEEERIPLSVYMSIDASWADKKSTGKDPTAIVVAGYTEQGEMYILDIFNQRLNPTDLIEKIFWMIDIWQPITVASEDLSTQKGLNLLLEQEMSKRNKFFALDKVKHQAISKENRILGLTPIFQNGQFFISRDLKEYNSFIEQYTMFNPVHKITHDDILDAIEMLLKYRNAYQSFEKEDEEFEEEFQSEYDEVTGRM